MERIEVIVRITKDHCPPQEQKLFEWDEREQEPAGTLSYPGLEINLEQHRVFKNGQEAHRLVGLTDKEDLKKLLDE